MGTFSKSFRSSYFLTMCSRWYSFFLEQMWGQRSCSAGFYSAQSRHLISLSPMNLAKLYNDPIVQWCNSPWLGVGAARANSNHQSIDSSGGMSPKSITFLPVSRSVASFYSPSLKRPRTDPWSSVADAHIFPLRLCFMPYDSSSREW